jgi:hypothetical protein
MQSVLSTWLLLGVLYPCSHAGFEDTMPGINNLLSMIKTRRRRDAIIMGVVIGLCLVLLLTYVF